MSTPAVFLSRALIRHSPRRFASLLKKHPELVTVTDITYEPHQLFPGGTALNAVVRLGHVDLAELLLAAGADVHYRGTQDGRTPLITAASKGRLEVVQWLLDHGARVDDRSRGSSALYWSVEEGNEAVARLLVDRGASLESGPEAVRTVFWPACKRGYGWLVDLCIEAGQSPVAIDNLGHRPLFVAAEAGHLELLQRMLPVVGAEHRDPLLRAAIGSRQRALVEFLLQDGFELTTDELGRGLLHVAAAAGQDWLVQRWLQLGAQVDAVDVYGNTPLVSGAGEGVAMVRLLLDQGADSAHRNHTGWTPLHEATEKGELAVMEELLGRGADVNAQDEAWGTALHVVLHERHSTRKNAQLVQLLLAHGADPTLLNAQGDSALTYAPKRTKLGRMLRAAAP